MSFMVCKFDKHFIKSATKESEKSETKSSSNLDLKSLSNDDPLWTFGQVKERPSPVHKYLKPLPTQTDEETINLQTTRKSFSVMR